MTYSDKVEKILYGGDYNPEQWEESVWEEDMRLFALAGIDIVTLNVFNWAALQKDEESYSFDRLDKIMELVKENGLKVCLATSTGAHPAWMAKRYPDILRTEADGKKRKFGGRHNSCPNSPTYQKYSVRLAEKLAKRYQNYENIVAWHISNEYGGECFCEQCEQAFREWLKNRYQTLDALNKAWNTAFWGHTFYDWDEIVLPNLLSEHFGEDRTMFQGISLDYRRFNSESMQRCFEAEYQAVKKFTPDLPVTTNLMGFYKNLDYGKWSESMDFISWDSYPSNQDSKSQMALSHDLMRGLKGGDPFVLMEQTPSVTNWQAYNALKRPGVMRLWSYQAIAHGADAVMFFQMRRSIGACEKFHGAVIDHAGHENTRVFREIAALGKELKQLGSELLGGRTPSETAILFDWENWWALEYSAGPSCELKYYDEVRSYYEALHEMNISTDIVGTGADMSRYKVVIAPLLYMTKPGVDENLRRFTQNGGTLIVTYFSGIVDEHDLVITGGYPGRLRDLLGIWVEETDALPFGAENRFSYGREQYPAKILCDIIHTEGAEVLGKYDTDFYKGTPVLTRNFFGQGKAYYVGTRSDDNFYRRFLGEVLQQAGIYPVMDTPTEVEAAERQNGNGSYIFLMNHGTEEQKIAVTKKLVELRSGQVYDVGEMILLPGRDVKVFSKNTL